MPGPKVNIVQKSATEAKGGDEVAVVQVKKSIPLWVFIVVPVILLSWGGGFLAIKSILHQNEVARVEAEEKKKQAEKENEDDAKVSVFTMEPMLINLASEGDRLMHLEVQLAIETQNSKTSRELQSKLDQIQDEWTMLLSSKSEKELRKIENRKKLQDDLLSRVNHVLKKGKANKVYFLNFLVQ
ncbi:MAG: flagellar basal body-associated FliL family protein [Deltaproteobacteria bacterium]|nr:flagellar basal body-associated FliL family protein [Deltaproteobacteria bacterium]